MVKTLSKKWYMNTDVPASPRNKQLGLLGVRLYKANANQEQYGIVCNALLETVCGHITVTVCRSKNDPDLLYLSTPGSKKFVSEQGEVRYYEPVFLVYGLKAQVLKYVESKLRGQ